MVLRQLPERIPPDDAAVVLPIGVDAPDIEGIVVLACRLGAPEVLSQNVSVTLFSWVA